MVRKMFSNLAECKKIGRGIFFLSSDQHILEQGEI
jgi:hypothetical protein